MIIEHRPRTYNLIMTTKENLMMNEYHEVVFMLKNINNYKKKKLNKIGDDIVLDTAVYCQEYIENADKKINNIINMYFNNKYKNDIYNQKVYEFMLCRLEEFRKLIINRVVKNETELKWDIILTRIYLIRYDNIKGKYGI